MKKLFKILYAVPFIVGCAPKTYSVDDYRLTMNFHDDFKILQLTDLHFGIESNLKEQFLYVKESIEEANPDLIILTGDNFMYGSRGIVKNTFDFINTCCKNLTEKNNRLTKFAVTYGNHDNQGDYHKYFMNDVVKTYTTSNGNEINENKYALFVDYDDDNLFGLTNYFIDLVSNDDVKYRLHIVDSNTYKTQGIKYGYDVIHDDQLNHMVNIYNSATEDKDYIGLAFFHIPLLQYKEAIEQYKSSAIPENVGQGVFIDKDHYPSVDNGSYDKMKSANIVGYFTGHDHKNYGDIIYKDSSDDLALISYGVKSTNQLYHDDEMVGYKLINLKDNITKNEFLSMDYVKNNIKNVIRGGVYGK